jgi:hypothetical protein
MIDFLVRHTTDSYSMYDTNEKLAVPESFFWNDEEVRTSEIPFEVTGDVYVAFSDWEIPDIDEVAWTEDFKGTGFYVNGVAYQPQKIRGRLYDFDGLIAGGSSST